jgi:hypothetical protein
VFVMSSMQRLILAKQGGQACWALRYSPYIEVKNPAAPICPPHRYDLEECALSEGILVSGRFNSPADSYKQGSENEDEKWNPPLDTHLGNIKDGAIAHAGQS